MWVVNLFETPSLLKNFGPRGNALLGRALTASGRDAIGARITVTSGHRKQIDEVRSGGYFMSQGDFRVHFGLGPFTKVDVTIRWPQGATETFEDVAANQWIVAREGRESSNDIHSRLLRRSPFHDSGGVLSRTGEIVPTCPANAHAPHKTYHIRQVVLTNW